MYTSMGKNNGDNFGSYCMDCQFIKRAWR